MNTQKLIHVLIVTLCFVSSPKARAVDPPPDGGYPNLNTAEGQNALFSLITGSGNTAVGWYSLFSDTQGSFNTATGMGALLFNTGDNNTAFGAASLLSNTSGGDNTALGFGALANNTTPSNNTAVGSSALFSNITGGTVAGQELGPNTAVGATALFSNTEGSSNTAVGFAALRNVDDSFNTAVGFKALTNCTGSENGAFGHNALVDNTTGSFNTAVGTRALRNNISGDANTAVGDGALYFSTGSGNIGLGDAAGINVTTANNVICIGTDGNDVDDSCYIGNIFNATSSGGTAVFVNMNGRLGTATSSRRFKEGIKPMKNASERLFELKPVTFRYKQEIDPEDTRLQQFGLIAEDVEKVDPDLVTRDKEGQPYSVRYEAINAMLLNEFLKEHRRVEAQQSKIDEQEMTIRQLQSSLAQQQKTFESKLAQQEQQIAALMADVQKLATNIVLNKAESRTVAEK